MVALARTCVCGAVDKGAAESVDDDANSANRAAEDDARDEDEDEDEDEEDDDVEDDDDEGEGKGDDGCTSGRVSIT